MHFLLKFTLRRVVVFCIVEVAKFILNINELIHFIYFFADGNTKAAITSDINSNLRQLPNGSLMFSKVDASMGGSYTCEASNDFGAPLSKTIFISVRGILS